MISLQSDHHTDVENLLTDFEKTVGSQIRSKILYKDTRKISDFDKNLLEIIANLRKEKDWVLVPSDKTGTWVPTETKNYIQWMNEHLNEKCKEVKNPELTATYKKANEILAKFESMMSESEAKYMKCWILDPLATYSNAAPAHQRPQSPKRRWYLPNPSPYPSDQLHPMLCKTCVQGNQSNFPCQ